ncbi:resuscitation-promoting factor [Rhodococcus sp. SRB_17]|nr:resuscitation-promoting factor [Rhodococcus sp. SRB_17]
MTSITFKRAFGAVATAGAVIAIPLAMSTGTASAAGHDWSGVANCESSGNWAANTGNGFYGGLQFTQSTWNAFGGSGNAANASQSEQIRVAENVLEGQGVGAWPVCGQYLTGGTTAGTSEAVSIPVTAEAHVESAPAATAGGNYVVKAGDTLSKIAAAHGISLENLASQVPNLNLIFPGQSLSV